MQSSGGFHSFDSPAKQGTGQRTLKTPPQGIGEEVARAHFDVCTITGRKEQTQPWHQPGTARKAASPWVMELPGVCCPPHTTGKGRSYAEEIWPGDRVLCSHFSLHCPGLWEVSTCAQICLRCCHSPGCKLMLGLGWGCSPGEEPNKYRGSLSISAGVTPN